MESIKIKFDEYRNAFVVSRQIIDPSDTLYLLQWEWEEGQYECERLAYLQARHKFPNHEIVAIKPIFYAGQVSPSGRP
ncbi:hypothetical protein ACFSUS_10010 [Spirosoma soli]|uniref:Uncharacterized protein n=1 Tax=Spirosoma soli TaxID=1770529 RepID=A0ABW5M1P8_9BACT